MNPLKKFLDFSESFKLTLEISKKYFRETILAPALYSILYGIVILIILAIPIFIIFSLIFGSIFYLFSTPLGVENNFTQPSSTVYAIILIALIVFLVLAASIISIVFYIKQNERMAEATELYLESLKNNQKEDNFSFFEKKFDSKVSFFSDFSLSKSWNIFIYYVKMYLLAITSTILFFFSLFYISFVVLKNSNPTEMIGVGLLFFLVSLLFFIFGNIYSSFQVGRKGHGVLAIIEGLDREDAWELSEKTLGKQFWPNVIRYLVFSLIITGVVLGLSLINDVFRLIFIGNIFAVNDYGDFSYNQNTGFVGGIIYLIVFVIIQFASMALSVFYYNYNYIANKNLLSLEENEGVLKEYGLGEKNSTETSPVE